MSNEPIPFKREDRYVVIKRSDLDKLSPLDRDVVQSNIEHISAILFGWNVQERDCLVIESDWPEYEPAWAAIEARVTRQPATLPQGSAVTARVCAYTPGMGQVELKLSGALPQWLELGETVTVQPGADQHQGEPVAWMDEDGALHTTLDSAQFSRRPITPLYIRPAEQLAPVTDQWPKLEKPALVGAGRFSVGLSARLVVEAAQRHYEYETTPENETLRIATGENFLALLAQLEQLRGLRPAVPPRPPEGNGLPRYGLRWNGPQQPLATPMDDGYWTPWHLAAQQQTQSFPAQFSALREAMESAAARRNPCQLIVGDIHIAVTYHGIKWFHTRISGDNQQHPLTIEEFDEIAASALGVKP